MHDNASIDPFDESPTVKKSGRHKPHFGLQLSSVRKTASAAQRVRLEVTARFERFVASLGGPRVCDARAPRFTRRDPLDDYSRCTPNAKADYVCLGCQTPRILLHKSRVSATLVLEQHARRSVLHDGAGLHHNDAIALADGGRLVRDDDDSCGACARGQSLIDGEECVIVE